MSSNVPADLKYSDSHEWVRDNGDGTVTVGITDHAQSLLGDLVHIDLPEENAELDTGDECGVVESVKAASDLLAPLSGTVVALNENLLDEPELVNSQPYEDGWMFKLQIVDKDEYENLMDAEEYQALLDDE